MISYPPLFNVIYSVSDLHLGGAEDCAMFNQSGRLANTINRLREHGTVDESDRLALVINGDFIDFLAEQPEIYFDIQNATNTLQSVIEDSNYSPVFTALQKFVSVENNYLIINLGNHDIELCLPEVQNQLILHLANNSSANAFRIQIVDDGTGFVCKIGERKILFIHGNEVDFWNKINYTDLRSIKYSVKSGIPVTDYLANHGTRLVVDVINTLKEKYPFVVFLKPEVKAVLPVLYAVINDKTLFTEMVVRIAHIFTRPFFDRFKSENDDDWEPYILSTEKSLQDGGYEDVAFQEIKQVIGGLLPQDSNDDTLLLAACSQYNDGFLPEQGIPDDENLLSIQQKMRLYSSIFPYSEYFQQNDAQKADKLRKVLRRVLLEDRTFKLGDQDDIFNKFDQLTGEDINILVAGHTHLRRSISTGNGRHYFNTGTWTTLMEFPKDILKDKEHFLQLFAILQNGTIADYHSFHPAILRNESTILHIYPDGHNIIAELQEAEEDGSLKAVENGTVCL